MEQRKDLTSKMVLVEERFSKPRGETLVQSLFLMSSIERMGVRTMASEITESTGIKLSGYSVLRWMSRLDIPKSKNVFGAEALRVIKDDPVVQGRRLNSIRKVWDERGEEIIAKRLASGWQNQSDSLVRFWEERPEWMRANLELAAEARDRANAAREVANFGNNPQETLKNWVEVEGFRIQDIADLIGLNYYTVVGKFKRYNINYRRSRKDLDREILEVRRDLVIGGRMLGYFDQLPHKWRLVAEGLYLARGGFPTQKEVAKKMKISREAVRQLDDKVVAKLEELLDVKGCQALEATWAA